MGQTARKTLLLSILALAIALLAQSESRLSSVVSVQAAGTEAFTQTVPSLVYEQVNSHAAGADADPAGGLVGYCVAVANEGNVATANGTNGFSVVDGTIQSTAFLYGRHRHDDRRRLLCGCGQRCQRFSRDVEPELY